MIFSKSGPSIDSKKFVFFTFLCYLTLFIFIFPDVVFYGATFTERDILRFYFPVWNFAVQMIKSGAVPLWNPYNSFGAPFLADIQTCVFYPLSALLYLPDYAWAFNFYILLHLALAGVFCCIWMKECGASYEASFVSGLAYGLGGYVMSAISLTISLATLVYFPLVLLTLRRSLRSDYFFWKAMTGILLMVQYLAGDPAVFFATMVVLTLFVLYRTAAESALRRKIFLKYAFDLLKIVAVFLGLSAFHTLLFFEFLMRSNRSVMGYGQVTLWSMQYNDLISIFFPYFSDISLVFMDYWSRQSWLENAYAGITVLMLAGASLKGVKKNNLIGYHVLLAFFGLALALGSHCSVYDILYHYFPFFKFIRYPVRFLFLFSFAAACLAGFGLDRILLPPGQEGKKAPSEAKTRWLAFFILFFIALILCTMARSLEIESAVLLKTRDFFLHWAHKNYRLDTLVDTVLPVLVNIKRTALFVCLFLTGILAAGHFRVRKGLVVLFFVLIVFVDLVDVNVIEIRLERKLHLEPSKNLTRVLQDPGLFRVLASPESVKLQYEPPGTETLELTLDALKETLTPNLLLPYRICDVSGYDSIFLKESIDLNGERRSIKDPTKYRFYDMLNIKYMVSPKEIIGAGYTLVQRARPVNLFLNERVLPRAFLVPGAEVIKNRESILRKLTAKEYDPEKIIYLDEDPPASFENSSGTGSVQPGVMIEEYAPNRVRMKVASDKAQWLFFSDMHYPGWKAVLNGHTVKIFRANYAFRAVRVPAGQSIVEWKYDPILFRIGSMISLATALALGLYFVGRKRWGAV